MTDSIWLVIFASAGLPLLFLAVLTYAEYIVEEKPFWEVTVRIAWDMAVLGIGLTGGLFFKKQKKFSRTYGMLALGFGFTSVGIPLLIWR